jgi:hypothetical protein
MTNQNAPELSVKHKNTLKAFSNALTCESHVLQERQTFSGGSFTTGCSSWISTSQPLHSAQGFPLLQVVFVRKRS